MKDIKEHMEGKSQNRKYIMMCFVLIGILLTGCNEKMVDEGNLSVLENATYPPTTLVEVTPLANNEPMGEIDSVRETNKKPTEYETQVKENEEEIEYEFFGAWEITDVLPGYISDVSQEEVDRCFGKKLILSKEKCEVSNQVIINPYYNIRMIPIVNYLEGRKIMPHSWDIGENEMYMQEIKIYDSEEMCNEWEASLEKRGVSIFYLKGRLIIGVGCEHFELTRMDDTSIEVINPRKTETVSLTEDEILGLVNMTRAEIENKLGGQGTLVMTGAEASYEGCYYEELGISISYGNDDRVAFVECDEKVDIGGLHAGMTLMQIKERLGDAKIEDTFWECLENKAYKIEYTRNDCTLKFLAFGVDESSYLTLLPIRK